MRPWVNGILALGGNLGEREKTIELAINELSEHKKVVVVNRSPLVESAAQTLEGTDDTKPPYLNGVVEINTSLKPKALLRLIARIEKQNGRVRKERWGSRTLDIDIITYGDLKLSLEKLTIPHPRAHQRPFVLVPWSLMDGEAVLPGHGSVAALAKEMQNQVWLPK